MTLKDIIGKLYNKKEKFKEMEDEVHFQRRIQEKMKSADERELERYIEENRQARIKAQLGKIRKDKQKAMWHGKTALDAPNVIVGHKNLMRQPNIFVHNQMSREKELFFLS